MKKEMPKPTIISKTYKADYFIDALMDVDLSMPMQGIFLTPEEIRVDNKQEVELVYSYFSEEDNVKIKSVMYFDFFSIQHILELSDKIKEINISYNLNPKTKKPNYSSPVFVEVKF